MLIRTFFSCCLTFLLLGCESGRIFSWQPDGGGEAREIVFAANGTSNISASQVELAPAVAGSRWKGDEAATRLLLFSWDPAATEEPDLALLRPRSGAPGAPSFFGQTREYVWRDTEADGEGWKPVDLGRIGALAGMQVRGVRMADIGTCSFRIPWVIDEDTAVSSFTGAAGFDAPGDGIAEQILNGLEQEIVEEGTDFFTALKVKIRARRRDNHPPQFAIDFDPVRNRDSLILRAHFKVRALQSWAALIAPGVGNCEEKNLSAQVRGRFSVADGRVAFDVEAVDIDMANYGRGRPICRRVFHDGITEVFEESLRADLGPAIAQRFNEALDTPLLPAASPERIVLFPSGMEIVMAEVTDPALDRDVRTFSSWNACLDRTADSDARTTFFSTATRVARE